MGLKINKQTNLEKLFDEFAIDPTSQKDNCKSEKKKENTNQKKTSNKK